MENDPARAKMLTAFHVRIQLEGAQMNLVIAEVQVVGNIQPTLTSKPKVTQQPTSIPTQAPTQKPGAGVDLSSY